MKLSSIEKRVVEFAQYLLSHPTMHTMPEDFSRDLQDDVREKSARYGLPPQMVVAIAKVIDLEGGCNCGGCLVRRLHPDAVFPETLPESRVMFYAALTFIFAARGPQRGKVCILPARPVEETVQ